MNDKLDELIASVDAMIEIAKELNLKHSREARIRESYHAEIVRQEIARPVEIEK